MKTKEILTIAAALSVGSTSFGATTFSANLQSASANLNLADTDGFGSNGTTANGVTYGPTGVTFSGTGNDSRNYLRTADSDYGTGMFAASVTWNGLGTIFVGYGGGNVGTFGVPDWAVADSLWVELNGAADNGPIQGTNPAGRFSSSLGVFNGNVVGGNAATPVRLQMVFNSSANTLQFFADNNYNGTFSADVQTAALDITTVGGGTGFLTGPGDAQRFYFGGESGKFSDFSVVAVPEPSVPALLGACGMIALLFRRRLG